MEKKCSGPLPRKIVPIQRKDWPSTRVRITSPSGTSCILSPHWEKNRKLKCKRKLMFRSRQDRPTLLPLLLGRYIHLFQDYERVSVWVMYGLNHKSRGAQF